MQKQTNDVPSAIHDNKKKINFADVSKATFRPPARTVETKDLHEFIFHTSIRESKFNKGTRQSYARIAEGNWALQQVLLQAASLRLTPSNTCNTATVTVVTRNNKSHVADSLLAS